MKRKKGLYLVTIKWKTPSASGVFARQVFAKDEDEAEELVYHMHQEAEVDDLVFDGDFEMDFETEFETKLVEENTNTTHDDLVADWKAKAEKHEEKNYQFLRSLKERSSKKVDRIALQLHQEAFSIVDCTKCANCCRTMRIGVTEEDIPRIAEHLGMKKKDFIAAYLKPDKKDGGYQMKTIPCPFLGQDNKCTIYGVRPQGCQGYPFTDKPDFPSRSITHALNAVFCPAVFYMVEQMKKRMGR